MNKVLNDYLLLIADIDKISRLVVGILRLSNIDPSAEDTARQHLQDAQNAVNEAKICLSKIHDRLLYPLVQKHSETLKEYF